MSSVCHKSRFNGFLIKLLCHLAYKCLLARCDFPAWKTLFFSLVGAIMGTPADVVKARMMNQPIDSNGRGLIYKSSFECLSKTIKNEGLFGLYKGFVPCWLRMAPWSLTFWLSYEQIRKFFGAKSWWATWRNLWNYFYNFIKNEERNLLKENLMLWLWTLWFMKELNFSHNGDIKIF